MTDDRSSTRASATAAPGVLTIVVAALIATGAWFRVMGLSSVPGISGDEGWWGVQALAWWAGRPYEAYTTSGNPTDEFFRAPLAVLHGILPPSFGLLRALPAAANLLALPVGFALARRAFGTTTAWAYTAAIAVLPAAIAHSRICQDPSQTVLWTTLVVFLSLLGARDHRHAWRYLVALLVVFPIALWTHPTNIFNAPFLLLPCAAALAPMLPASRRGRVLAAAAAALVAAAGLAATWFALTKLAGSTQLLDRPWLSTAAARLVDGRAWFEVAANGVRFFNGVTIYHYFSGARPFTLPFDAAFVLVVTTLAAGLALRHAARLDRALVFACAGTWLGFFAIAGPEALRPHAERWGLCLVVPSTIVLARGLAAWIEWRPPWRLVPIGLALLVAMALLASFYVNYFTFFAVTGGRGHLTYVTAPIEPKQQALAHILARTQAQDHVVIATHQWWLYWPMSYLASVHPHVTVSLRSNENRGQDFETALGDGGRLFFVEFAGTPELVAREDWMRAQGRRAQLTAISDASGRDLIAILEVLPER
jgi:hypothetical protein